MESERILRSHIKAKFQGKQQVCNPIPLAGREDESGKGDGKICGKDFK
jgi:hypothetical protein